MKTKIQFIRTALYIAILFAFVTPGMSALKEWNGTAADTLWSSGGNWAAVGVPGSGDNVTFTALDSAANPLVLGGATNNVVDAGFASAINSLGYRNIAGFHNTRLINPLTVIGSSASDVAFIADDGREPAILFVGSGQDDGAAPEVYASIFGGSLAVSNGNANISIMQTSASTGNHRATLDLNELNTFDCVVSNIHVGYNLSTNNVRPTGTLILAKTNSVTATSVVVADVFANGSGRVSYLRLGQVNSLNANRIGVGLRKSQGTLSFNAGLTAPAATFRDVTGVGRVVAWEIGDATNTASSSHGVGIVDLSGGVVDALVDRITVGRGQNAVNNGDGTGTLTIGGGAIDANFVEIGIQQFAGGSVGRGTLSLNNDAGVGPSLLTVNSNLVMAVQLPGNTDAVGATAVININGGTLEVMGEILDGDGLSTINLSGGGRLDLKPAGDTTAGNLAVDILNISSGVITNFDTLTTTNINLVGPASEFTLHPGQRIAPQGPGTNATLNVVGSLKLKGEVALDISKFGGITAGDSVQVSGAVTFGGNLTVTLAPGSDVLAVGDKFTLFAAAANAGAFATLNLPSLAPGLFWFNNILVDGSIEVADTPVAPTFVTQPAPAAITCFANSRLTFRPVVQSTSAIDYRWRINSADVPGATNATVMVSSLGLTAGNTYTLTLQASNSLGVPVLSDPVTLIVVTNPPSLSTLYAETFSDAGSVPLNGRQVELSTGCANWLADPTALVSDGKLPYSGLLQQYLPFTPQWGHVYTFSVDINVLTGGPNWLAMGFVSAPDVDAGAFYVGAAAWMLAKADRTGVASYDNGFGGAVDYGPGSAFDPAGYTTFTIVLDTTTGDTNSNTGWTVHFVQNGVLLNATPHVYGANPTITYLGVGGSGGVTGEFDNLLVTDSVVGSAAPTPPSILPTAVQVYSNTPISLTATTVGACPIYYQWLSGSTIIPGATNATLNVQAVHSGSYSVIVSNLLGSATNTTPVTLTVLPDPIQAFTIYKDSFTGLGGAALDGRVPEVSYGGAGWLAEPRMLVDSNQLFCAGDSAPNASAFLPFVPKWGHVYVFSVDMNPLTGGANWVDLGFTSDPDINALIPDIGGGPWMLQRSDRSASQFFNLGYGSVGSGVGGNGAGYTTWKIVLDTTTGDSNANTGWTATFVKGATNSFGDIMLKYVYGPNPIIQFASFGFGSSAGVSGNVDNFRLTDSLVPLAITQSGSDVILTWSEGILLEAPAVTGPWTTNNAASPYIVSPTAPQKYFRVQFE